MTNSNENNMDMRIITVLGFITNHKEFKDRKVLSNPKAKAIWPTTDKKGNKSTYVRIQFVYGAYNANGKVKNNIGIVTNYVFNERVVYTDLDGNEVKDIISVEADGFLDQAQKATNKNRPYNRFFTVAENLPKVGDVISVRKTDLMSKEAKEHLLAKAEENAKAQAIVDAIMG